MRPVLFSDSQSKIISENAFLKVYITGSDLYLFQLGVLWLWFLSVGQHFLLGWFSIILISSSFHTPRTLFFLCRIYLESVLNFVLNLLQTSPFYGWREFSTHSAFLYVYNKLHFVFPNALYNWHCLFWFGSPRDLWILLLLLETVQYISRMPVVLYEEVHSSQSL